MNPHTQPEICTEFLGLGPRTNKEKLEAALVNIHCSSYHERHWFANMFINIDLTNNCDARRAKAQLSSYGQKKFSHSFRSIPGEIVGVTTGLTG